MAEKILVVRVENAKNGLGKFPWYRVGEIYPVIQEFENHYRVSNDPKRNTVFKGDAEVLK